MGIPAVSSARNWKPLQTTPPSKAKKLILPQSTTPAPAQKPNHLYLAQAAPLSITARVNPSDQDPFLMLEEIESPQALEWVRKQNEASLKRLESDPRYALFQKMALEILQDKERIPQGSKMGNFIYNFWQDENHLRGIWRRTTVKDYESQNPRWEIVLDVDQLAKEESENWVYKGVSCLPYDYRRCMIQLSRGGKDAVVAREFDTVEKAFVTGGFKLPEAKSDTTWIDYNTLVVGTDFGADSLTDSGYPRILKSWERGKGLEEAKKIFEVEKGDVGAAAYKSFRPGDEHLIYSRMITFWKDEYYIVKNGGNRIRIPIPEQSNIPGYLDGEMLVHLKTDWQSREGGPKYQQGSLIAIPMEDILEERKDFRVSVLFAPTDKMALKDIHVSKNYVILDVLKNVSGKLLKASKGIKNGKTFWNLKEVPVSPFGTIHVTSSFHSHDTIYYSFNNFVTPDRLMKLDLETAREDTLKQLKEKFDARDIDVIQLEAISRDKTKIPYFMVFKRGIKRDAKNPTLLYGYGGFEIPQLPYYGSVMGKLWLEKGGIYVLANIRGGGEFGPRWHQAALKENRQKAFDDFLAVAEDLIRNEFTSPKKLGIMGGSNGGLLVGAAFTQRPDLFNAVVCQVPLLDMLRYHKLLAGKSWVGEYGDPEDPNMRRVIREYSPYHNVKPGVKYPEVLFTTSTKDDRVHPGHARKMAAKMQSMGHPVLYLENTEGGHGGASNLEQRARSYALQYLYLHQKLFDEESP